MSTVWKRRLAALTLLGCLIAVGWVENLDDYGPIEPGPNAPAYVDWRTGNLVQP
jgi:hypothetical protein